MERKCKKLVKDARSTLKLDQNTVTETVEADNGELALSAKQDSKTHSGNVGANNTAQDDEDDDFGFDPERYVPFSEKADFAELIKRVTKEGLTQIVNYLLEKQPEAIDDFGNDRLQIKIDMIEREAFDHCKEMLNINLKEMPNKRQKVAL
jgi:hypothetical protein